ncbi:MAG: 1-(5-phosphoribosyl)-5-[(5-phosphoribosylamino)methylideneamino]imidazole-4-carboxamide isomerase [Spirochaetales bacterium]|nr:1-(5-phosphoribosyl)-5-[(5-phosphoribosylamino)methylideneamino]imidazole-4-carboxamide isomerase [Spirochaetales bacterium]
MLIIPAIDLLDGHCVRLFQGKYEKATQYSLNPVKVAQSYAEARALWIHLVDLDGARGQGKNNRKTIREIRNNVNCHIETGGGIRTEKDVEELLEIGIDRLILGTILIKEPERVKNWIKQYGHVFSAGIDAFNGQVKVSGWESGTGIKDTDLALKMKPMGLSGIIYTNISKDGTFSGPDILRTNIMADTAGLPVIISGGIGSRDDIENIAKNKAGNVIGTIVGKAIYENRVDIGELISEYQVSKIDAGVW